MQLSRNKNWLKEVERDIQKLEKQLVQARALRKTLKDAVDADENKARTARSHYEGMSNPEMAEMILQERGEPETIRHLAQEIIERRGDKNTDAKKLASTLYSQLVKSSRFVRPTKGKALFGLAEAKKQRLA